MKAVILAAGRGKRMRHLTETKPKPLLRVGGKTFLDHIFDALPKEVDEVIVVVGYKANLIRSYLGKRYKGKRVVYVKQKSLSGTGHAVLLTKQYFQDPTERFFIIYGDELPTKQEIKKCLARGYGWLCHPITHSIATAVLKTTRTGRIIEMVERRDGSRPPFISAGGGMLVSAKIFAYKTKHHKNCEYYLTSMLDQFLKYHKVYMILGRRDLYFINGEDIRRFNKKASFRLR